MIGPDVQARVLVLRAQTPSTSDRLVVYDERDGTLVEAFSYEPIPEIAHVHQPTYPPTLNTYAEGAAPQKPNGYRISIMAVRDFTGDANPDVLLTLSPQLYLKNVPVLLAYDQLAADYVLEPIFADRFEVGGDWSAPSVTLEDLQVRRYLYRGEQAPILSTGSSPGIPSLGAANFALIQHRGELYLAAAFALNLRYRQVSLSLDVDCAPMRHLRAAMRWKVIPPCGGGAASTVRHSTLFNMKAWRFRRQGVQPASEFCDGPRMVFRATGETTRALHRNWRKYISRGRFC